MEEWIYLRHALCIITVSLHKQVIRGHRVWKVKVSEDMEGHVANPAQNEAGPGLQGMKWPKRSHIVPPLWQGKKVGWQPTEEWPCYLFIDIDVVLVVILIEIYNLGHPSELSRTCLQSTDGTGHPQYKNALFLSTPTTSTILKTSTCLCYGSVQVLPKFFRYF